MSEQEELERPIVHQHDGHWWFWDECWCERHGPYISEIEASKALQSYITNVLGYDL